jgi:hypothetical protein
MSTAFPAEARFDRSRDFAKIALVLGAASIVLFFFGFGPIPYGGYLSLPVAFASLVYAVRTFRRPRRKTSSLMALVGGVLALFPLVVFAFLVLVFEFTPGD